VAVSGSTLALCFFGLVLFPIPIIRSLGLATGLTITVSIVVNLTFLPALLITFPSFFTDLNRRCKLRCSRCWQAPLSPGTDAGTEKRTMWHQRRWWITAWSREQTIGSGQEAASATCWSAIARFCLQYGWAVVVVLGLLAVPAVVAVHSIRTSHTQQELMPRGSEPSEAYTDMVAGFGTGALFPYWLLIVPKDGVVESAAFFDRARILTRRAVALSGINASDITVDGVMLQDDRDVPYGIVHRVLHASPARCKTYANLVRRPLCDAVRTAWTRFTNGNASAGINATATRVSLALRMDPFSDEGMAWLDRMREALPRAVSESGGEDDVSLFGAALALNDTVSLVREFVPWMMAGTLAVIFALVALAFRSLVVPVRAVFTVSLSLALTYALTWAVYGLGALDALGWPAVGRYGGLNWASLVLSWPVGAGLGFDYDIFLIGRILEFRAHGNTDRDAIASGLEASGPLITSAGIIMAIAFGALLFFGSVALNELAFILAVSVLLDSLVVRAVLVPSAMALLGAANWWPRAMPPTLDAQLR